MIRDEIGRSWHNHKTLQRAAAQASAEAGMVLREVGISMPKQYLINKLNKLSLSL